MDPTKPQPDAELAYELPDASTPRPASSSPTEGELEHELARAAAHDPYAALRHRDYRIFSIGWMTSVIGNLMTVAALRWEIFEQTHSKLNLGWIGGIQAI